MFSRTRLLYAAVALLACGLLLFGWWSAWWSPRRNTDRQTLLRAMPDEAQAVLYLDLDALRSAPFLAELLTWASKPGPDPAYEQLRHDTGFDYEKDLERIAIAFEQQGTSQVAFAVAAGRFNRRKLAAFAARSGTPQIQNGHEIYSLPLNGAAHPFRFTFLRSNLIALTNGSDLRPLLEKFSTSENGAEKTDWLTHFDRLAGSPLFMVLGNDGLQQALGAAQSPSNLAQRSADGLASPQLSSLLRQLQWVTIAAKPEGDRLRVVAEGESSDETVLRQLNELLNGVTLLASAGLNDPKTRKQLPAATRDAYRDFLKSIDISRVDRGETKSIRLIADLSPQLLKAAPPSLVPPPPQPSPSPATPRRSPLKK